MWVKEKRPTGVLGYHRELGLSDLQIHRNLVPDSHVTLLRYLSFQSLSFCLANPLSPSQLLILYLCHSELKAYMLSTRA